MDQNRETSREAELPDIITPALIEHIRRTYRLPWNGVHGWDHWVRVCENGLRLASIHGANQSVVALFAFTHDMDRRNEHIDPGHGLRAAGRIRAELRGMAIPLIPPEWDLLEEAAAGHTLGLLEADITIQTCWDADRLDLGRAGIRPEPHRLCTPAARSADVLEWAYRRSITGPGNRTA
jgi:uncharacterized protein